MSNDQQCTSKLINNKWLTAKPPLSIVGTGVFLIFLSTCLVYTPTLKNDFIWDDVSYVIENPLIRSLNMHNLYVMATSFHAANWHPLTWLSLAIDYALWDLNPFGYHLTNIIVHGLNTLLVFLLTMTLVVRAKAIKNTPPHKTTPITSLQTIIIAGVTALLFGLHPLHVESVAWIAERKDLLCAFFVFLCIISYLLYKSSCVKWYRWSWFASSLFLFVCALISKPMAVTLPVIFVLLDIYPLKDSNLYSGKVLSVFIEKIPFFILSTFSGIITIMAQQSGGALRNFEQFQLNTRVLNALRASIFYLEKISLPITLVPFYPSPSQIYWLDFPYALSTVLFLTITGGCLWMVKKRNYLLPIAWSYYLVTLLPVLGIIQVGGQAAADRYTYLPSLSIFIMIGIGVSLVCERAALLNRKGMVGGVVLALIFLFVALGQLTIKQIKIWHDSETFWSYVISVFPFPKSNPLAHYNLGNAYAQNGKVDKAISEYERALILKPSYAEARNNLGNIYGIKGNLDKATSELKQALAINPRYSKAYNNLGNVYYKKGKLSKALSAYMQAIAIEPNYAEAHNNISSMYYSKGDYERAIAHCDRAFALGFKVNPNFLRELEPYRKK